ncbi:hypothetical protein BZG02_12855 [Labilibaculum filiforme]|uniref:DUF4864 domain-containing protein n=1 Tax=Labilibaculum filiforme TaxID=1940526 RepID=A0A2N3HVX9_9BACT|nr:hypothetical protein [Labilibaculum filiforme]PKQ62202.1 hypothetical protein BZG02_12855 [Labilibaculum filiforme]
MKKILFAVMAILFLQSTKAQTFLNSKDELSKHSEKVMNFLKDSEFQKAFTELQVYWPLPENEMKQLESQTIKQFNMVADRFGNIIGFDFIRDESIKDYAIKKIYVLRFEKHMIRVLFTYYKNNDGWILNGFKWDDQFDELFE